MKCLRFSTCRGPVRTVLRTGLALAVILLYGVLGCGNDGVLGPEPPVAVSGTDTPFAGGTGSVLQVPGTSSLGTAGETLTWVEVTGEKVLPGTTEKVTGSRYTLTFDLESLKSETTITIKERDSKIVDVDLGPEGLTFEAPVLLEIDYSGTVNDPSSPHYNGLPHRAFWYDPATGAWKVMAGTDDPKARTYRVWLHHFSRYAMGDVAGWAPRSNSGKRHTDEIQWY